MAALEPGATIGQYRILEPLGAGGMATVYKALHTALDRVVAVKVLAVEHQHDPSFLERFRQEARTVARLRHPNILEVFDFGEQDGLTYIVMEYMDGGTLATRLVRPMATEAMVRIVDHIAAALDYAHGRGVLHRDIKPSNILMTSDDDVVVGDFGLAKILEGDVGLTRVGAVVGTPEYLSPEQAMGQPLDARSDVYSLGATLYHLLVGRQPFAGSSPLATIVAHVHDPLPPPRSINPALPLEVEAVLTRALAKNPDDRYASAGELARSFAAAVRRASGLLPPSGIFEEGVPPSRVAAQTTSIPALTPPSTPRPGAPPATTAPPAGRGRRGALPMLGVALGALSLGAVLIAAPWRGGTEPPGASPPPTAAAPAVSLPSPSPAGTALATSEAITLPAGLVQPAATPMPIPTLEPTPEPPTPEPTPEPEPTAEPTSPPPPTAAPPPPPPPATRAPPPTPVPTRIPPTAAPTEPPPPPTPAGPIVAPMGEEPGAPRPPVTTPLRIATAPPGVPVAPMGEATALPTVPATVPALIMGAPTPTP